MKAKPLLLLSLTLVSVNVMANPGYGVTPWGDPLPRIAQMNAEERRLLQLRWDRMTPEEQALLRQQFREQLLELPPEQRRLLQLRWDRMTPEEQALLRQQLREQLLELPPEQREFRRREIIEGWREQPTREREYRTRDTQERRGFQTDERHDRDDDAGRGFGRGFERRNEVRDRPGRR